MEIRSVKFVENLKLSDFLTEDSVVKTKLEKSEMWIPNVAYKIFADTNEIEIALDDRYLGSLVMVGDNIEVTQTIDKFEYIINAVLSFSSTFPLESFTVTEGVFTAPL